MSKMITYDSQDKDITCMKEYDALKYPCNECDRTDCEERENYSGRRSNKCTYTKVIWVVYIHQMNH